MVKPKGVWLDPSKLGELEEVQVVRQQAQPLYQKPAKHKKKKAPSLARRRLPAVGWALAVSCCALLGLVSMYVLSAFALSGPERLVTVSLYGEEMQLLSQQETVADLLKEQGIRLGSRDELDTELSAELYDGMVISIEERYHRILIQVDGQTYYPLGRPATVAEALHAVGVEVSARDEISLPLDTPITADTIVNIARIYSKTVTELEEITPSSMRVEDASLTAGETKVLQEGEPGRRENLVRLTYRDDQEMNREVISSQVVSQPGITMIAYGSMGLASRSGDGLLTATTSGGTTFSYSKMLTVEATAYTWTGNTTATGTWPTVGQIAVDPRVIPLGSKVYVEGYGFATATDTGGAIKGNIIDVYLDTHSECINWGRKKGLALYIIE